MDEFKKTNGMWNVGEYFMLSHPVTMLKSMEQKNHDRFIAYKSCEHNDNSIGSISLGYEHEIVLTIDDLRSYIISVRKANK